MKERINLEYLNLYQEIPLFCLLVVMGLFRASTHRHSQRVLIVNTCLIGEFVTSLPAIRDYIERNAGMAIDLMVSPPLKVLAQKVRGVGTVYTAKSLYGRHNEHIAVTDQKFPSYDTIFVMRASKDAFQSIRTIQFSEIRTGLRVYSRYALHLLVNLIRRRLPKQWREINFKMLGGSMRTLSFDEIFQFTNDEYDFISHLDPLQTAQKKVIVHMGSSWSMKRWGADRWVAFLRKARQLGDMRFIFVGGEEEIQECERVSSKLDFPVYSLVGKVDLVQLMLVLRGSDYFVGIDSGPRNMAHLADVRSVSILGPGPHFYMPWDDRDIVLDKSRGRGLLEMFFARKNTLIDRITPDEVYDGFKRIWNS